MEVYTIYVPSLAYLSLHVLVRIVLYKSNHCHGSNSKLIPARVPGFFSLKNKHKSWSESKKKLNRETTLDILYGYKFRTKLKEDISVFLIMLWLRSTFFYIYILLFLVHYRSSFLYVLFNIKATWNTTWNTYIVY